MTTSSSPIEPYDRDLYLVHLAQIHETFRKAELTSLAVLHNIPLKWVEYSDSSPYAIVSLPSAASAALLVSRSILTKAIYHLWARAPDYPTLHRTLQHHLPSLAAPHLHNSFKFTIESFQHKHSSTAQRSLIESFSYLSLLGPIRMRDPTDLYTIFESHTHNPGSTGTHPHFVALGLHIANGARSDIDAFDLKKRQYIGTTSMDAELALITGNMALCAPGKIAYDPFVGTGSFIVACAHLGAVVLGSDIDGRQIRGKTAARSVRGNFEQYKLQGCYGDCFIADLTNAPLREREFLDAVVCDPPYGVREGLKVLGHRDPARNGGEPVVKDGVLRHTQPDYVPPKKPYSFDAMLGDILEFSARNLVVGGRLCFWMPTANEGDLEDVEDGTEGVKRRLDIPSHPRLRLESVCVQEFNKWSRRLLTYTKLAGGADVVLEKKEQKAVSGSADDLNDFRKRYFEGFKPSTPISAPAAP